MVFNRLAAPASGGAALAGRTIGTDFASSLATNEEPPPPLAFTGNGPVPRRGTQIERNAGTLRGDRACLLFGLGL